MRLPMAPAPGWASAVATRASSQPGWTSTSSFRRTSRSPRACRAPRLHPPAKPRLTSEWTVRIPPVSDSADTTSAEAPLATTTVSVGAEPGWAWIEARQRRSRAALRQARMTMETRGSRAKGSSACVLPTMRLCGIRSRAAAYPASPVTPGMTAGCSWSGDRQALGRGGGLEAGRRSGGHADERTHEGREVVGLAGAHEVAVDDDLGVLPHRAGIDEIIGDRRPGGRPPPGQDAGRRRDPPCVADERDRLAPAVHLLHEAFDCGVRAELVGPVASRKDQDVERVGRRVGNGHVGAEALALLADDLLVGVQPENRD